jgi:hypothetical protein
MVMFINGAIDIYRARVIASSLRLYAKTGMKPNRAYTPTSMLKAASGITGEKYKRGEYLKAAADLTALADEMQPVAEERGDIIR